MGCKGIPLRSVGEWSRMGIMLERKFSNWRIGAEAWALWMARGMGRRGCAMLGDANGKNESIGQRPRLAPRFEGRISLAAQRSAHASARIRTTHLIGSYVLVVRATACLLHLVLPVLLSEARRSLAGRFSHHSLRTSRGLHHPCS